MLFLRSMWGAKSGKYFSKMSKPIANTTRYLLLLFPTSIIPQPHQGQLMGKKRMDSKFGRRQRDKNKASEWFNDVAIHLKSTCYTIP